MSKKQVVSAWFIRHPVATTLITATFMIIGFCCYPLLPIAPLPQTDIPTIRVTADLPGASAETMASAVAMPLENAFAGISGIDNMISASSAGRTTVTVQFNLKQNIDAAAQEIQAAVNNVSGQLPQDMPSLPEWKKVNPADSPVLVLILKSEYLPLTALSDLAENVITKQLGQISGIAEFNLIGQQRPAVNIKVHPERLSSLGITLSDIRNVLQKTSVNRAKGAVYGDEVTTTLQVNDQLFRPEEYADTIIAVKNGNPVYLKDVAEVLAGTENQYVRSWPEGKPGISIEINRQPGANIVKIADEVRKKIPELQKMLPKTVELSVLNDRTRTIRSSLHEVKLTFIMTLVLVLAVIAIFLKNISSTSIVAITLACIMVSSLGAIYLLGFSINNLTLLALIIAIGFVADDIIVVVENIHCRLENGNSPVQAAAETLKEILFTMLAITLSLAAAFIPLFFMGGIVGKLFYEFAATVVVTIFLSAFFSLVLTPMLASKFMKTAAKKKNDRLLACYGKWLEICFNNPRKVLGVFALSLLFAVIGFVFIPKGFFPLQDIGYISGSTQSDEDISFKDMSEKHRQLAEIIAKEPALQTYTHAVGDRNFSSLANGKFWLILKDRQDRELSANELINKLRAEFSRVSGIKMSLRAVQDMNFGIAQSSAQYVYALKSQNTEELYPSAAKLTAAMKQSPLLKDVQSDLRLGTRIRKITVDRRAAARYGVTVEDIDQLLYDAFGQRQIGKYQTSINQYRIILGLSDDFAEKLESLNYLYLKSSLTEKLVPLSAVVKEQQTVSGPLVINRDNRFPAVNISFNLADGVSLGQALAEIEQLQTNLGIPDTVYGVPQGAAQEFAAALDNEILLILLSLAAVYIILGILYESFLMPFVIISTLPSGLVGAILFLYLWKMDFSVIAIIGCIMLIGIVLKNGILMVDTALKMENETKFSPKEAIYHAAVARFRPIMMTSVAAILAATPLIIGQGTGAELRQPLGVVIVGGLFLSQLLTIFTTPIIYLYINKLKQYCRKFRSKLCGIIF